MAQMKRNVNLEEIDSDALFGIDALKNQSPLQKVIFFGSLTVGVLLNVILPIFTDVPVILCIVLLLVLLFFAVMLGCNYTEDMTYGRYLINFFFKPEKPLFLESTESRKAIKKRMDEITREEEETLQRNREVDEEAQRRLLLKMAAFIAAIVILFAGAVLIKNMKDDTHHVIDDTEVMNE